MIFCCRGGIARWSRSGRDWVVTDLVSKNGTYLDGQEIGRHLLSDGESVRIGNTVITFCVSGRDGDRGRGGGDAMKKPNKGRPRPTDPFEALSATVSGFDYVKSLAQRNERLGSKPRMSLVVPQPPAAVAIHCRGRSPCPAIRRRTCPTMSIRC